MSMITEARKANRAFIGGLDPLVGTTYITMIKLVPSADFWRRWNEIRAHKAHPVDEEAENES